MAPSTVPLRTYWLAANGRLAPVVASTMPRPYPGLLEPLSAVNPPPMATLVPWGLIARAATVPPVACGAQSRRAPLEALKAARYCRSVLPTPRNEPPAYTVVFG